MGEHISSTCRIDFVSLANNHILDFQVPGMLETQRTLDAAGIRWAGSGNSLEEAARPAMLQVSPPSGVGRFDFGLLSDKLTEPGQREFQ
jgi:poly-gamma-glutamate capsule biosynthesis protein CapA/YwtB (metallophosphatase superfamily)